MTGPGEVQERPRRVDGSMSLLVDMMANTLDEAYAERAARTTTSDPPRSGRLHTGRAGVLPVVALVVIGLVTGTAVAQVRDRQAASSGLRSGLAAEVRARTSETDDLAARAAELRDEVASVRESALGADAQGRAAARRLAALGAASATTAVSGPGLEVRLDDAPPGAGAAADPLRGGTVPDGRVQDRDLQDVANGLWAAGAEAISINGQRLSVVTAVRSAGESVLVDLRPIAPPYVVRAIGDPAALELEFVDGPTGRRLTTFTSLYGIAFSVRRADELRLPAASAPDLRLARPVSAASAARPSGAPS